MWRHDNDSMSRAVCKKERSASMKYTIYRATLSALAFAVAIITIPLAAIAWPFAFAWIAWSKIEEENEENAK